MDPIRAGTLDNDRSSCAAGIPACEANYEGRLIQLKAALLDMDQHEFPEPAYMYS